MRYQLISLKDRAINAFMPLGSVRAEGEALRVFIDLLKNPQTPQHAHADDYDLYILGEFDDQTGIIEPQEPRKIADGKNLKQMIEADNA